MKKIVLFVAFLSLCLGSVQAQGFLGNLKDRAVNKMKEKVEEKVDQTVDDVADDVLNGKITKKGKKSGKTDEAAKTGGNEVEKDTSLVKNPSVSTTTDFKRGSVIMFEDDVKAEQVGEFPSKWDLLNGSAETKTFDNYKSIEITNNGVITPLIKEEGAYLPEEFTIEYDFYYWDQKEDVGLNDIRLILATTADRSVDPESEDCAFILDHKVCDDSRHSYEYNTEKSGDFEYAFKQGWHHVALSFNKRALKVYFDGNRVINLPNVVQPTWFAFRANYDYHDLTFIRNVVLAKGAVALYDRNEQSMTAVEKAIAETGKFVTNNILFDTGKATLKPESLGEIQKVADYMKKNTSARFEVQGHTDNQGSDKINDPLSQKRAEAIVQALVAMGCDEFNLRAVGKGSHEPVADNKTEEGRAQNRRVVFVKK